MGRGIGSRKAGASEMDIEQLFAFLIALWLTAVLCLSFWLYMGDDIGEFTAWRKAYGNPQKLTLFEYRAVKKHFPDKLKDMQK